MKKILLAFLLFTLSAFAQEKPTTDPLEKYPEYFKDELNNAGGLGEGSFFQEFIQMMIYLIGIIAFMVFFMWILKRLLTVRLEQSNKSSHIKIIESRAISQKTTLYIIEVYDQAYTIAESLNGVTCLGEVSFNHEPPRNRPSFNTHMNP